MTVSDALKEVYVRYGKITSSLVLSNAEEPTSPLHSHFTWDDGAAAHEYRLIQARGLIRKYKISVDESEEPQRLIHIRINDDVKEGEYHPANVIVKNRTWFDLAMAELNKNLSSLEKSVDELKMAAAGEPRVERIDNLTKRYISEVRSE